MRGMSMEAMVMGGMLAQSQEHSSAALSLLDRIESSLRELGQVRDPKDRVRALERANKALEEAREHLARSIHSIGMAGDVKMLDENPARAKPHLGGDHEAAPAPGAAPLPADGHLNHQIAPAGVPENGKQGPGSSDRREAVTPGSPVPVSAPFRSPGVVTPGAAPGREILPSLRGTPGFPAGPRGGGNR